MVYKNYSCTDKTFYGVTFKPGETKEVNNVINSKWVLPIDKLPKTKKAEQQKPSPEPRKDDSLTSSPSVEIKESIKEAEQLEVEEKPEDNSKSEEKQNKGKKS